MSKKVIPRSHFEAEAQKLREQGTAQRLSRMKNKSIVELEPEVRKFCVKVAEGMNPSDAAALCGYDDPGKTATHLMRRPQVRRALNEMIERTMKISEITRNDVIEGFKDAIAISRQQSEAMGMIAGWREIGKMLGMYETKIKVEVTGGASEVERQLKSLPDEELLRMVHERSALLPDIEDAEFEEVTDE